MIKSALRKLDQKYNGGALLAGFRAFRSHRAGWRASLGNSLSILHSTIHKSPLAELCDNYGSDKGTYGGGARAYPWPAHRYIEFYSRTFDHCRFHIRNVFECGLGTNDPSFSANMGPCGRPGASLRVWRDYFPLAQIYGADIDLAILFTDDRIKTFYVDQTSESAVCAMWSAIGVADFDLIIDDGLHSVAAAFCLLQGSFARLRVGGIYVIEDMPLSSAVTLTAQLQAIGYQPEIVTTLDVSSGRDDCCLVVVRRNLT